MTEDDFVAPVTEGQAGQPRLLRLRRPPQPRGSRRCWTRTSPRPPSASSELLDVARRGGVVLDTRSPADFAAGHLRGSINVGLEGRFAEYAGDVVRPDQDVVLVCEPGTEHEAKVRLARIGFDRVVGYLEDPVRVFVDHPELVERQLPAHRPRARPAPGRAPRPGAWSTSAAPASGKRAPSRGPSRCRWPRWPNASTPAPGAARARAELDPARPTVVYCAGGYRSQIAASALPRRASPTCPTSWAATAPG